MYAPADAPQNVRNIPHTKTKGDQRSIGFDNNLIVILRSGGSLEVQIIHARPNCGWLR